MAGGFSTENLENAPSHELMCRLHKSLQQYIITPGFLPTPEKLVEWGGYDIQDKAKLFPNDVASNIDTIFSSYINRKPELPYVSPSLALV